MTSESQKILREIKRRDDKEAEIAGTRRGYWLVKESDKSRYYIHERINLVALERVANNVLTDTDYDYWIDYCHGLDITGRATWSNVDQTNSFF